MGHRTQLLAERQDIDEKGDLPPEGWLKPSSCRSVFSDGISKNSRVTAAVGFLRFLPRRLPLS